MSFSHRCPRCAAALNAAQLKAHIESVEDQQSLRQQIVAAGLTAFVRDGSILPRNSGDTDTPMRGSSVVAFRSPEAMTREFKLPNCGAVRGMAIPRGVTLIVGGGFHGKSTLLQALELGVYDHIPGDGREFVVTDPTAVKVGALRWQCSGRACLGLVRLLDPELTFSVLPLLH